jgi:hypothetical protein
MTDTIHMPELQQLIIWISSIEEAVEFINENVEEDPFGYMGECTKITKALNKMRGMLILIKD